MSYGFTEEDIERQRQKVAKTQEGWTYAGKIGETIDVSLKRQQGPSAPLDRTNGQPAASALKPSKYHAQPVTVDGIGFASKRESRRYQELKLLAFAGAIRDIELQPRYDLIASNGEICGHYTADFRYFDLEIGKERVEDVKGGKSTSTEAYRLRKRFAQACHGIIIEEV